MKDFKKHVKSNKAFIKYLNFNDDGEKVKNYTIESLVELLKNRGKCYEWIKIPKKKGGHRDIVMVKGELLYIQRKINNLLRLVYNHETAPNCVYGFVHGGTPGEENVRGIKENAKRHVGKKYVLNMDLKDFFGSINADMIKRYLSHKPFKLHPNGDINAIITITAIINKSLPQGAPTSPILSNIVCKEFDYAMKMIAKKYNQIYTRYADDMTFSGNSDIDYASLINTVEQKARKHKFKINKSKTRLRRSNQRQTVTGLVVNDKVGVRKEFIMLTKSMLYNWERYGIKYATHQFELNRNVTDGSSFENVLRGRIDFIGSILNSSNERVHPLSRELKERFWVASNTVDYSFISNNSVRNRLQERNIEGEKISLDKRFSLTQQYRFVTYCFSVFLQMEILFKYYLYLRFDGDFKLIGEFLYDTSKHVRKKKNPKGTDISPEERRRIGRLNSSNITDLKNTSTASLEYVFMYSNYDNIQRPRPKFFNFLREIRNYHAHGGESILHVTFDEVKSEVKEIIKNKKLNEITLNSDIPKGVSPSEVARIKQLQFYLWFNTSPFEDVRLILKSIATDIEVLEGMKKINAANT